MKPTMPKPTLTRNILLAALAGFQLDKQGIDAQITEVQAMLGGSASPEKGPSVSEDAPKRGRRKRSAAVRKRMAEAQRLRWLKIKGESTPSTPEPATPEPPATEAPTAKRKISAHGMKNIIAATKKRWRLQKAAAKAAKKAASKKAAVKAAKKAKKVAPVKKTAVKKTAVKKAPAKKMAPVAAPAVAEAAV